MKLLFIFCMVTSAFCGQRIVPHVTSETGGFDTWIILTNQSDSQKNFALFGFDSAGNRGDTVPLRLEAGETQKHQINELFETRPSHFQITADETIRVSLAYRRNGEGSSEVHLHEASEQTKEWTLYGGDWAYVFDALAIVNTDDFSPASVQVTQRDLAGNEETKTIDAALAPMAKALYVLNTNFTAKPDATFVVSSDRPIAIIALRGNHAADLLWENRALAAVPSASYTVTFEATWSASTHPTDFPGNPHFSNLIGVTHNGDISFWADGELASPGIKSMAETGSTTLLTQEFQDSSEKEFILSGGGISTSPGSVEMTFDITREYSRVTLVSMLAPSPDWFVGISGLNLWENGDWADYKEVTLYAYDAGTDSGTTYTAADAVTNPFETIYRIPTAPLLNGNRVPPVGVLTFLKND